ncbi:hypothetical protein AMAG_15073 [Allomyces macrogynus ATCC 38327]|uniref:Peptidase M50B-like-domain-containing protein n=1 Tax=Allomyces macrogynus (strain ATCC 38327) TaxID=578462 RepID=A0A0L0T6C6_ALLM3|nr:hypothetical protein AMAG_15073 [Allomyces macrogynus ATCC 38327]|eukprot:KNE70094.1 hypothetical protein AMAG_15073 [Allomyces macrogynus ATCC 38327]
MAPPPVLHLIARAAIDVAAAANASKTANATIDGGDTATTNHTSPLPPPPFDFGVVFNGTDAPKIGQMLLDKLSHPSMQMIHVFEIMGAYFFIFAVLWNMPYLGRLLDPLKLIVVAFHEFSHAIVGKCTGAKIESIEVNPDQGGATRLRGGNACLVLPAGYIGSSIFGSLLVFCSFDLLACKVSAGIVAFALLCTLWWARDNFTRWLTGLWFLQIVLLWVFDHGSGLKVFTIGVASMSITYSFWDMVEDLIRRRVNHSDAAIFAKRYGCTPQFWGVFWFLISLLVLAFAVIMAMLTWP